MRQSKFPGLSDRFALARLGDNVGGQLVFDLPDPVSQLKLALLEALHLEYVGAGCVVQGLDGRVQVPMLLAQPGQNAFELPSFRVAHSGGGVGGTRLLGANPGFAKDITFPRRPPYGCHGIRNKL